MRLLRVWLAYAKIALKARRNRLDQARYMARRPLLFAAINGYEAALLFSHRVEPRLKYLAGMKTASLVGCPF